MMPIRATKSYVVIDRVAAHAISVHVKKLEALTRQIRSELTIERTLLQTCALELAEANGARDRQSYARRWIRTHRLDDLGGLPIAEGSGETKAP
jgi:hypothetical protein